MTGQIVFAKPVSLALFQKAVEAVGGKITHYPDHREDTAPACAVGISDGQYVYAYLNIEKSEVVELARCQGHDPKWIIDLFEDKFGIDMTGF